MSRRVSVRDVARAAGVSISTVSRVLNGSGYASAPVREKVAWAVDKTGYVPNYAARHLRTGRSRAVGFMVSNLANPFLAALFAKTEEFMSRAGFTLLVASTYDDPEREAALLTLFERRQLEGIFAAPGTEGVPRSRNPFARCGLPLVIFDREIDFEADVVCQGHREAVQQAVEYLASLGHRRIALLGPNEDIRPGREKLLGYRDGLQRCGLRYDPGLACMLRSAVAFPEQQVAEMLESAHPPTAVIPRDISVIGIGTPEAFALTYPPMTTLRFNLDRAVAGMAGLMLDRVRGATNAAPRRLTVPIDLVLGETCAPLWGNSD